MSLKIKKELSSTEQASNETVAKKSWRYLFANPDRYISKTKNGNKTKNAIKIDGSLPFAVGRIRDKIDSFFI